MPYGVGEESGFIFMSTRHHSPLTYDVLKDYRVSNSHRVTESETVYVISDCKASTRVVIWDNIEAVTSSRTAQHLVECGSWPGYA